MKPEQKPTIPGQEISFQSKGGPLTDRNLALLQTMIKGIADLTVHDDVQVPLLNKDSISIPLSGQYSSEQLAKIKVFLSTIQKIQQNADCSKAIQTILADTQFLTPVSLIKLLTASIEFDIPELTKLLLPPAEEYFFNTTNLSEIAQLLISANPILKNLLKENLITKRDYCFVLFFKGHGQIINLKIPNLRDDITFDTNAQRIIGLPAFWDRLCIWDPSKNSCSIEPKIINFDSDIDVLEISKDAKYALSCHKCGNVSLLDLSQDEPKLVFAVPIGSAEAMALSADNKYLVTLSAKHGSNVWEINEKDKKFDAIKTIAATPDGLIGNQKVIWSLNNKYIATNNADGTVSLWDFTSTEKKLPLAKQLNYEPSSTQPRDWACSMRFSSDNYYLVAGYVDGRIFFWDLKQDAKTLNPSITIKLGTQIMSLTFTSDSSKVLIGLANNEIWLWDFHQEKIIPLCSISDQKYSLIQIALSDNGEYLFSLYQTDFYSYYLFKMPWRAVLNRLSFDQILLIIKLNQWKLNMQDPKDILKILEFSMLMESLPDEIKKTVTDILT